MTWASPTYPASTDAFKQALSNWWPQETKRFKKSWISVPGRLGSFSEVEEKFKHCKTGWPRFGSVTVWGWNGSTGSGFRFRRFLCKKGFSVFQYSLTGEDGSGSGSGSWKHGSGGSGSAFGFGKNGSDGSGFRFQFGSWATLQNAET